jgi:hypothetical protein
MAANTALRGLGHFFSSQGLTETRAGDWYLGFGESGVFYGTIGRVMIDMPGRRS